MDKPADRTKYLTALKAWHDKLTPAQKAALSDSLGLTLDPGQQAQVEWFNALDPGVQTACVQLPIVAVVLASLSIPGTSETPPDSVLAYAKTIADIRDLQIDTDLRHILDSLSTELRRHAHDTPPINDPVLTANAAAMGAWIDANCTMPE